MLLLAGTLALTLAPTLAVAHDQDHGVDHLAGLDPSLFMDGAVVDASIVDCTLSDATETRCHSLTIAGHPVNHDTGFFMFLCYRMTLMCHHSPLANETPLARRLVWTRHSSSGDDT
ncbi:hypothetical protein [Halomonas sp. YLGW01]|uniref:hypothetical protein n=1 Tax=Halomonas sp. YLGW01 TaxID=2773308 RepID=UPI0017868A87|nr:hypothetical protein [Halomonas sp. YLGW01]